LKNAAMLVLGALASRWPAVMSAMVGEPALNAARAPSVSTCRVPQLA